MANFAPDAPSLAPAAGPTFRNAAAADSFDNNGDVLLYVKNTTGSPVTVTIDAAGLTVGPAGASAFNADVAVSVPATTGERLIGPFPPARFNDSSGRVQLSWSATGAGITWAAVRAR
jgi:hypothetical protein